MTTAPSGQARFALGAQAPCIDLRRRVVEFVTDGGSKAEASRRYKVSLWCVND